MTVNTFAGAQLDRAAERRSDGEWLRACLENPASRVLAVGREGPYVREDDQGYGPALTAIGDLAAGARAALADGVLLGLDETGPLFAADADALGDALAGSRPMNLREAGARVSQADGGLLAFAAGMVTWHRNHPFCARCGSPTRSAEAGFLRVCDGCKAQHHPRTDPVVIMLVHDGDRVLLGRQAAWPAGRYSALAGFVEPGESLEEAVGREVFEETGVEVDEITYRSSQPWPFPASLMLGFHARYRNGTPHARDSELADVGWFSRAQIAEAAGREEGWFLLPPRLAIARSLVDEWRQTG